MQKILHRALFTGLLLIFGLISLVQGQDNAQICIRLYEDRASAGSLDAGDPFITRDVGVNLANAEGIIIQTALIDDAPQGSSGRVCFTQLAAGQYTVSVASAAYTPTTDSVFVTNVSASAVPLVFDVGMQRIQTEALAASTSTDGTLSPQQARLALEKIFVAGMAALIVTLVMIAFGAVIYVLFVRPRPVPQVAVNPYAPPATGAYRTDTSTMRAVTPTPQRAVTDSHPVIRTPDPLDDTGASRPLE